MNRHAGAAQIIRRAASPRQWIKHVIAIPYVIAAKRSDRPLAAHYAKQYAAEDLWNRILHRDGHLPPRRMWFVGGGDFEQIGRRYHDHLVNYAGLRPDSRVLDVGCGIGRMAIPLTTALGSDGSYDGFDVVDEGIRWCRRNITTKHPNFRFTTIEAQNGVYRPRGRVDAHSLRFPYEDASFDIVLLASVFTHMQEAAVAHYLHEIRRVLRPAGRAFVTVFLLDNVSRLRMATNRAEVIFDVPMGRHAMTAVAHQPEWAVGLDAAWFYEATAVAGLALDGEVKPGLWRGETSAVDYQDVVVLQCNAR